MAENPSREEELMNSLNQLISTLLTFMQLLYRGTDINNTPFKTHPKSMRLALATTVVYHFNAAALLRFPPPRRLTDLAHHFVAWCAYASVAALTSVLSPPSVAPLVYSVFAFIAALELLCYCFGGKQEGSEGGKNALEKAEIERGEGGDHEDKDSGASSSV